MARSKMEFPYLTPIPAEVQSRPYARCEPQRPKLYRRETVMSDSLMVLDSTRVENLAAFELTAATAIIGAPGRFLDERPNSNCVDTLCISHRRLRTL